jgi:peptide deformylase
VGEHETTTTQLDGDVEPGEPDERIIPLRFFGDQVLRRVAKPVADIDGAIRELGERMLVTMAHAEGVGLAGPQVGAELRLFTHALDDLAPTVLVNPEIVESRGEWVYQEGCLSIPGLYYDVVRPKEIHLRAWDLDGREVDIDADEMLARVCQHEIDHLDGVLFVDRLTGDDRALAERELRHRVQGTLGTADPFLTGRPIRRLLRRHR